MVVMATVSMVAVVEATSVPRCGFVCGLLEAWYLWVMMPWTRTLLIREQSVKLLVSSSFTQVRYFYSLQDNLGIIALWEMNRGNCPFRKGGRNSLGYKTCCSVVLYCGLDIVSVFWVRCITVRHLLISVAIRDTNGLVHTFHDHSEKSGGIPFFFIVKEFWKRNGKS